MNKEEKEAKAIKEDGTLRKAVEAGALEQFQDVSLSEAVVLGLVNQEVRTFVGIFGHGMTDVGEALRIYEEEDVIKTYNVRNEVEASHIASMLPLEIQSGVSSIYIDWTRRNAGDRRITCSTGKWTRYLLSDGG